MNSTLDTHYFETMRWDTHVPGMVRDADEVFARYTTPHKSMRYVLGHKIPPTIPTAQLSALIDAETARARDTGIGALCWRVHGRDVPTMLAPLLIDKGYKSEEPSTQHFATPAQILERLASRGERSSSLSTRQLVTPDSLDAYHAIWEDGFPGQDHARYINDYKQLLIAGEQGVAFFAAFEGEHGVASGYLFHNPGARMALLCGGSTLKTHQKRGAYHALVARRVQFALVRGVQTLCVDASAESMPILQKLGFTPNDSVVFYEIKFTP